MDCKEKIDEQKKCGVEREVQGAGSPAEIPGDAGIGHWFLVTW